MPIAGAYTYSEIMGQAASWRGAWHASQAAAPQIQALWAAHAKQRIIFTGCGSAFCLALWAAPLVQRLTGRICRSVPASELWLQTETLLTAGETPLVVALSRSGETSETIAAVLKLRAAGSAALAITCYAPMPLSQACDLTITIPEGQERSLAQTGSFAGMLVAVLALVASAQGDAASLAILADLAAHLEPLLPRAEALARHLGPDESLQRITYLGSGPLYGLAQEGTVKMKEMSRSTAEAYHFMEFRHGPMSLVDQAHLIVALLSDTMRDYELAVLRDLRALGARILLIADDPADTALADHAFALESGLPEPLRAPLYLPLLQLLAYHRAMGRKLNPDVPRNVAMAVRLDGTEML